jgi:hypothetical protein
MKNSANTIKSKCFEVLANLSITDNEMNRLKGGDGDDPGTDITAPDTPIYIKED